MHKYLPDIISLIGLGLLGYGLFMLAPWLSFSVCGSLLILFAIGLGRTEIEPDRKDIKAQ